MITGGSGGIGAASALALAGRGAHIAAFGRRPGEEVAALRDQVHSLGGKFWYGTGDVEGGGMSKNGG
jgi:NAD(P)-dependent dehydrogenase (short-subunit alcohol dehydrogenase family)